MGSCFAILFSLILIIGETSHIRRTEHITEPPSTESPSTPPCIQDRKAHYSSFYLIVIIGDASHNPSTDPFRSHRLRAIHPIYPLPTGSSLYRALAGISNGGKSSHARPGEKQEIMQRPSLAILAYTTGLISSPTRIDF